MNQFDDVLKGFKEAFKQRILNENHNASGNLMNSMMWEVNESGNHYIITITLPEYAMYLENGTKPHFPNLDAIKSWIQVKHIVPRANNGKVPTTNQLAYLIGRKIAKEGTKPTHLIENTMNDFQLINKLYDVLAQTIQDEIKETLNK